MNYIIAILLFELMIFVHELGHFVAAKLSGVAVTQFTIGFGPALVKKRLGGTLYALRLLPIGGAVMMKGEEGTESEELLTGQKTLEEVEAEGIAFPDAPLWKRFIIIIAGVSMNFLLSVLILLALHAPAQAYNTPKLGGFMEGFAFDSPEYLQTGDRLVRINDLHIFTVNDIHTALALGAGAPYEVVVERDGRRVHIDELPMTASILSEDGSYKYGLYFQIEEMTPLKRPVLAVQTSMTYLQSSIAGFRMLFRGKAGANDLVGTVGMANELGTLAKTSKPDMWNMVAFISANLAFVNLLPIPGLDGGKLPFMLAELIARRKLNPKYEAYASVVGILLVLGLFVFVTYHDIARLIGGS